MPSLFGGSRPSGTTTTVQTNPSQEAQLPFLTRGWQEAQNLYNTNPVKQIAGGGDPNIRSAYSYLGNLGRYVTDDLRGQGLSFWDNGGRANIYNSPAYGYFNDLARGTSASQQRLGAASEAALGYGQKAAGGNLGLSTLGNIAQGQYLNANPYTAAMVQNALDPVIRNYQTAVAPQVDASFETAGRYGSGAARGAADTARDTLARSLGGISSNLYGTQFANERALQNQAAANYGQIANQGQQIGILGAQTAANAAAQGLQGQQAGASGLQGGYQAGSTAALEAARQYPSIAQAQGIGPGMLSQAGAAQNALDQPYLDAPFAGLERYLSEVGAPLSGSSSTTAPYFQNQLANLLGGAAGTLGIASGINNLTGGSLTSGLNSLFGGSGLASSSIIPGAALNAGNLFGAGSAIAASLAAPAAAATPVAVSTAAPIIETIFGLGAAGSDRRLKKEDGVIGHLANGLPIHTFKYLWDGPHESKRIGLMADEVAQVHPDAVRKGPFGFAMVDYARAVN